PHLANWFAGIKRDRRDRAVGSNADPGHDAITGAIDIGDRRHHAQIDLAVREQLRADQRHVKAQRHRGVVGQPFDERPHVQIADRPQADDATHAIISNRPSRSAGSAEAARMWRSISAFGARRTPAAGSSYGDTASRSSAPYSMA